MSFAVGVDLGASSVRAALVVTEGPGRLRIEARAGPRSHGDSAVAAAVAAVVRALAPERGTALAIAAPGARTADARGIAHARYLPAQPRLLDAVQRALETHGLALTAPRRLSSDALAHLVGEHALVGGAVEPEASVLFLGPGTGIAEACSRRGLVARPPGPPARELRDPHRARDLEEATALAGIDARWRGDGRVEDAARAHDPAALELVLDWARALGTLAALRLDHLARARQPAPATLLVGASGARLLADAALGPRLLHSLRGGLEAGVPDAQDERVALPTVVLSREPCAACAGAVALELLPPAAGGTTGTAR